MPVTTPDLFWLLAEEIKDCLCVALEEQSDCGCPCRACVIVGPTVWDDCECGSLTIALDRVYVHGNFPTSETGPIFCSSPLAGDFTITLLRCAPTVKDDGTAPSCDEISASARQIYTDFYITLRALICCLAAKRRFAQFVVREAIPVGPDGGCVGFQIRVTIMLVEPVLPVPPITNFILTEDSDILNTESGDSFIQE